MIYTAESVGCIIDYRLLRTLRLLKFLRFPERAYGRWRIHDIFGHNEYTIVY